MSLSSCAKKSYESIVISFTKLGIGLFAKKIILFKNKDFNQASS